MTQEQQKALIDAARVAEPWFERLASHFEANSYKASADKARAIGEQLRSALKPVDRRELDEFQGLGSLDPGGDEIDRRRG